MSLCFDFVSAEGDIRRPGLIPNISTLSTQDTLNRSKIKIFSNDFVLFSSDHC